jgi:hypothetical protein
MNIDKERATKAAHTAAMLRDDLRDLARSDNALLAELAIAHLEIAARLELAVRRIPDLIAE